MNEKLTVEARLDACLYWISTNQQLLPLTQHSHNPNSSMLGTLNRTSPNSRSDLLPSGLSEQQPTCIRGPKCLPSEKILPPSPLLALVVDFRVMLPRQKTFGSWFRKAAARGPRHHRTTSTLTPSTIPTEKEKAP